MDEDSENNPVIPTGSKSLISEQNSDSTMRDPTAMRDQFVQFLADPANASLLQEKLASLIQVETVSVPIEKPPQIKLPTFVIPPIDATEKLHGHSNYRSWKIKVERDLLALGRIQFVQEPFGGSECVYSAEDQQMLNAQAMQYLDATLQPNIKKLIANESDASSAFAKLIKLYGKNDIQKMVELLDSLSNLQYRPRMHPVNFLTKFENAIQEFSDLGSPLDEKFTVAYFLQKIRGTNPFMAFYTTVVTLPEEVRTFDYVRNTFLDIANANHRSILESEYMSVDTFICYSCCDRDDNSCEPVITICISCFQVIPDDECTNFSDSVTCTLCNEHDNNLCDFCSDRKPTADEEPPHKKSAPNSSKSQPVDKSKVGNQLASTTHEKPSPYTPDQLAKMKKMTPVEKQAARCNKCGLLFHKAADCKNQSRHCYFCHAPGHEKKDCRKLKTQNTSKFSLNSCKVTDTEPITFLVDSGASHHCVTDKSVLNDFRTHEKPIPVSLAKNTIYLSALGEGSLTILVQYGKFSHILQLVRVQFIPELSEHVLSVRKFNMQFKTSVVLNAANGYMLSRKLRRRLSLIFISDGLYRITARICSTGIEGSPANISFKSNDCVSVDIRNSNDCFSVDTRNSNDCFSVNTCKSTDCVTKVTVGSTGVEDTPSDINRTLNSNVPVVSQSFCLNTITACQTQSQLITKPKVPSNRRSIRRNRKKLTKAQLKKLTDMGQLWHRRMGHISSTYVNRLPQVAQGVDDLIYNLTTASCTICSKSKLTRKPCLKDRDRASRPCEILHADLLFVNPVSFPHQNKYILSLLDDFSRYAQVFPIKTKTETSKALKSGLHFLQSLFPTPGQFRIFRSDCGTEFTSETCRQVLDQFGIHLQLAEPNQHEHNGTVERFHRTIQARARSMLFESGFPIQFWDYVFEAACYAYNRSPHSSVDLLTPYEKLYGKQPINRYVKLYGSQAEVKIENIPKGNKTAPRSKTMYLLGYTDTGYIFYDPQTRKFVRSCNADINEEFTYHDRKPPVDRNIVSDDTSEELVIESLRSSTTAASHSESTVPSTSSLPSTSNEISEPVDEIETTIQLDTDWDDNILSDPTEDLQITLNACILNPYGYCNPHEIYPTDNIPQSYQEALKSPDRVKWLAAIQEEFAAMDKYAVWTVVERTPGIRAIPLKWLFTIKPNCTYKARIVAVGCRDTEEYSSDDTASPTPSPSVVKLFLALSVHFQWHVEQLDIKSAFLNGTIDRTKYVGVPEGAPHDRTKVVYKLRKALYGLPSAPHCWFKCLDQFLRSIGFEPNLREPCLFVKKVDNGYVILLAYVDDLLITASDPAEIEIVINQLKEQFELKTFGYPTRYLGLEFIRSDTNQLFIHQMTYIQDILKEFRMDKSNSVSTPLVPQPNKSLKQNVSSNEVTFPYKKAIGSLLYISVYTRPDIAYAVNYLARFQSNPESYHWTLVKRVLRYLNGTKSLGLLFKPGEPILSCYVDADFGRDNCSHKSTTGFLIRAFGCPITWSSKLQSTITLSTAEAEYIAITHAASEILFLSYLLLETVGINCFPVPVYEDNEAARQNCLQATSKSRLKHIERRFLLIRQYVRDNQIIVNPIGTEDQLADLLTKPLLPSRFCTLRDQIMSTAI